MVDDPHPRPGADRTTRRHAVHLVASLDGLRSRLTADLAERARRAGTPVRGSEARILHLVPDEGARASELAAGAWITKQAISRRIHGMRERGLVTVEPDPDDRRAVVVRRTREGDRLRTFTVDQIAGLEAELADLVGADRYRTFREVADELAYDFLPDAARSTSGPS